jgi:hypothetical protein
MHGNNGNPNEMQVRQGKGEESMGQGYGGAVHKPRSWGPPGHGVAVGGQGGVGAFHIRGQSRANQCGDGLCWT